MLIHSGLKRILALTCIVPAMLLSGCNPKNIKPVEGGDKIGVVLMHGKDSPTTRPVDPLAASLRTAGVKVVTPLMPWTRNRIYDKTFEDSLLEIQGHVRKLRAQGATRVYLAGHSLGAVTSAGYGARIGDVDGIVLLAPGHFTNQPGFSKNFGKDLETARAMIEAGKGENKANFRDINSGVPATRHITARVFLSWFSPTGPAEFVANMSNISETIPLLYVAGSLDRIPGTQNRAYAFDKVPRHPKSQFVVIPAAHGEVPEKADEIVIEWLRGL